MKPTSVKVPSPGGMETSKAYKALKESGDAMMRGEFIPKKLKVEAWAVVTEDGNLAIAHPSQFFCEACRLPKETLKRVVITEV